MFTNEQLFRIFIEEGFGKGDVTVFDKYASPDFIEHQYGFAPQMQKGSKKPFVTYMMLFLTCHLSWKKW